MPQLVLGPSTQSAFRDVLPWLTLAFCLLEPCRPDLPKCLSVFATESAPHGQKMLLTECSFTPHSLRFSELQRLDFRGWASSRPMPHCRSRDFALAPFCHLLRFRFRVVPTRAIEGLSPLLCRLCLFADFIRGAFSPFFAHAMLLSGGLTGT